MVEINWIPFLSAAVVLLVPATLLYSAAVKDRLAQTRSARFRLERMLLTWQHWFDLARGFGASYLLIESIRYFPDEGSAAYLHPDFLVVAAILAGSVLLQTIHYRKFFYFTAPVFFLWGMTLALGDWQPAVFAIVFSALIARLGDHLELKLPLMAGLFGVSGYLLGGFSLMLVLISGLILLPMLLAWCSMSHLVCYSRAAAPAV